MKTRIKFNGPVRDHYRRIPKKKKKESKTVSHRMEDPVLNRLIDYSEKKRSRNLSREFQSLAKGTDLESRLDVDSPEGLRKELDEHMGAVLNKLRAVEQIDRSIKENNNFPYVTRANEKYYRISKNAVKQAYDWGYVSYLNDVKISNKHIAEDFVQNHSTYTFSKENVVNNTVDQLSYVIENLSNKKGDDEKAFETLKKLISDDDAVIKLMTANGSNYLPKKSLMKEDVSRFYDYLQVQLNDEVDHYVLPLFLSRAYVKYRLALNAHVQAL